jgi:hypothetical protein
MLLPYKMKPGQNTVEKYPDSSIDPNALQPKPIPYLDSEGARVIAKILLFITKPFFTKRKYTSWFVNVFNYLSISTCKEKKGPRSNISCSKA